MFRICFVCLGNICRSPTAEAIFHSLVKQEGLSDQVQIDSAGTAAYHEGEKADPRSRSTAKSRGTPCRSIARQFTATDFDHFDWIVAMDQENHAQLCRLASDSSQKSKLFLLRSFCDQSPKDANVPDPYYGGDRGFEDVYDICERACQGMLHTLLSQEGPLKKK